MDFKRLTQQAQKQAKKVIDDRGGKDALKADAQEIGKIIKGKGSPQEKAKAAAAAIKTAGAPKPGARKG